jgi:hypothetical protein
MVEASAVMGHCHPFFRKAGMRQWAPAPSVKTERMMTALEMVGIDRKHWIDSEAVHGMIETLDKDRRTFIEQQINAFLQKFPQHGTQPGPHGLRLEQTRRTGQLLHVAESR